MVNENLNFDIKVERVKEAKKFVWPYFLFVSYESRRGSWPSLLGNMSGPWSLVA